jgi:4-amino-4-deoxy-L-arabinose transferase-like glycosyltransferase
MGKTIKEEHINYAIILALILISSFIIFNNLGASSFVDWDEAIYAENALEILKTNDWVVIKYGASPSFINLKPPLGVWLTAISFKVFGVNAFALRFWSALSAIGIVIIVYLFGKEITNKTGGVVSALFLLIIPSFIGLKMLDKFTHGARTGNYDILLTFFITLSLFLFYLYEKKQKTELLIASSASIALAVLTKGVIGLFPIAIVGIYLLYNKSLKKFINKKTLYSLLTFFIIVVPWFVLRLFREDGKEFFTQMFYYDILGRTTAALEGHAHEWYYYFSFLTRIFNKPFLILLVISFIYAIYLMKKKDKAAALLVIWISLILLVFTIAKTKIRWYIVPIYPAISLLVGNFFNGLHKYLKIKKIILLLIFILITLTLFLNIISLTNRIYIDPEQETLKYFERDLREANNVYISDKETGKQAIFFILNLYVKGNAIFYYNIDNLNLKEKDYIISLNRKEFDIIKELEGYKLIRTRNNISLFKKL